MKVYSTQPQVLGQQIEVQRLVIPFEITGHATPASKTLASGLPGVLHIAAEGQAVTGVDASATGATLVDADGQFGLLIELGDSVASVIQARVRRPAVTASLAEDICGFVDSDGLTENGNVWLQVDTAIALSAAATTKFVLELEYKLS